MAGSAAHLFHFQENRIRVAVDIDFFDELDIAGFFAFAPEFVPAAAVVTSTARTQCFLVGFSVHPGQHEHFTGLSILGYRRHQAAGLVESNHGVGPLKRER